jgi:hypothetical protein
MSNKNAERISGNVFRIQQAHYSNCLQNVNSVRNYWVAIGLTVLSLFSSDALASRGRPKVANNTIVTDKGTLIRGARVSLDIWDETPSQADVATMKNSRGLNAFHIYAEYAGSNRPGGYNASKVDKIIDLASKNDLYVVLTIGCGGANGSFNQTFVTQFWNFYAPRYKDSTFVFYELMNEPQAWSAPYRENVLTMEKNGYKQIRELAPETHIMMMSYSQPVNATQAANECEKLGVDWTNASVAFHTYGIDNREETSLNAFYTAMKAKGIAYACTEPNLTLKVITTKLFEKYGVSQTHFINVKEIDNQPNGFTNWITSNKICWKPDFGTWPSCTGTSTIEINTVNTNNVIPVNNTDQTRTFNSLGKTVSKKSNISTGYFIYETNNKTKGKVCFNKSRFPHSDQ